MPARNRADRTQRVEDGLNDLRETVGRTDALTDAIRRYYDERSTGTENERVEERVSYLIDLAAETAQAALTELDQLREEIDRTSSAEDVA